MSNLDPKAFVEMIKSMDDYRALSYSGRAMYGKECVGVSVPRTTNEYKFIADILDAIAQDSMDEDELQDNLGWFSQQLKSASSDNFGLDTVFYFKRMEWVKEEELDGEEDECRPVG